MFEKEKCRKGFAATSLISNLGHAYHVMVVMSHDMTCTLQVTCNNCHIMSHAIYIFYVTYMTCL